MFALPKTTITSSTPVPPAAHAVAHAVAHARAQRTKQLLQITNLLALAYHRNKNQHRRSRWWKELGMLRRNLRRVVRNSGGGGGGVGATAIGVGVVVSVGEDKASRTGKKGGNKPGRVVEEAAAVARRRKEAEAAAAAEEEEKEKVLEFVRTRLMPRCWVAFSGLVADTQYAGLGLMLLGTLGRLAAVMGWEGEWEEEEQEQDARDAKDVDGNEMPEAEIVAEKGGEVVRLGEDLGVPLVREEVMDSEEVQKFDAEKTAVEAGNEARTIENKTLLKKKKGKGKKKHHDAIDELFSGLI